MIQKYQIAIVKPSFFDGLFSILLGLFFLYLIRKFYKNRKSGIYFVRTFYSEIQVAFIDGTVPLGKIYSKHEKEDIVFISPLKTKIYMSMYIIALLIVLSLMFVHFNAI